MKVRSIYELVDALKKEVPKNVKNYKDIIAGFDDVIDSANYRAPEAYCVNFDQLAMVLGNHIGEPDTDWKKRIAGIFNGKIDVGIKMLDFPFI